MHNLQPLILHARSNLYTRLKDFNIKDPVRICIRPVKGLQGSYGLACYRSFSQFKSQPRFWIDPTFEAQITEDRPINKGLLLVALTETFYHEYGHVICEFANLAASWVGVNTRELQKLIGSTQLNEEDFCEAFLRFLAKRPQPEDPKPWKFRRIISTYRRLAFLDQTKFK